MKKIIIALALIISYSAGAQTTTGTTAKTAKQGSKGESEDTYVVCTEEGGYYNCCVHHKKKVRSMAKRTAAAKPANAVAQTNNAAAKTTVATATPKKSVAAPAHRVAAKHKRSTPAHAVAAKSSGSMTACRMVPYQVCKINPDRRSVTCYPTTSEDLTPSGPGVTYGDSGPMPGETVKFRVKTIVIKGEDKGAYCRRNKEDNGTICVQPGLIVRDENGYYSYGEPASHKVVGVVSTK